MCATRFFPHISTHDFGSCFLKFAHKCVTSFPQESWYDLMSVSLWFVFDNRMANLKKDCYTSRDMVTKMILANKLHFLPECNQT